MEIFIKISNWVGTICLAIFLVLMVKAGWEIIKDEVKKFMGR